MPWLTIVGVVGNLKHTQLMNEMSWVESPILYRPLAQEPRQSVQLAVRAAADVGSLWQEIRKQVAAVDPSISIGDVETLTSRLGKTLAYPQFRAMVLAFFALCALILSTAGLHGVLSQLVVRRMCEFGIRSAVGAQTQHLLLLIARQGGVPVLVGLAAGLGLTLVLRRTLASLLYGIQPADPKILAAVSLTLLIAAAAGILLPATRAARVDPFRMLGIDHPNGRQREAEPGADPGISRGRRRGNLPGTKPAGFVQLGEPDIAPAKL
jgi:predicted lysophospholipase L1 biosynthesis ABC-type transport system permease subunit